MKTINNNQLPSGTIILSMIVLLIAELWLSRMIFYVGLPVNSRK
jgi:hypothetical protein